MRYFKLFIDMDEVLMGLSEYVRETVNEEFSTNYKEGFNQSYWWQDYQIDKKWFEDLLNTEGTFLNGQPIPGAIEGLNKLKDLGFEIHIITLPQYNSNFCFKEKVAWIKKHLPWLNINTNFHTTGNKGLMAKDDRILLDDSMINLESWLLNKGISIAFGNYGWNKDWNRFRAANWNEVVESILKMEGINTIEPKGIDVDKYREYIQRGDD